MQILPVLDVMGGQVVRAVGGRRSEYRPLVSRLTDSTQPFEVMAAFREKFGWTQFYVAELDAIIGGKAKLRFEHVPTDFRVWVDAGVRSLPDIADLTEAQVVQIVVGTETMTWPRVGRQILGILGPEQVTFSLDLRNGQLMGVGARNWNTPEAAAQALIEMGGRQLIILDLARVGESSGTGTDELCSQLIRRYPDIAFFVGGGIRGIDDLRRLRDIGVKGALIASALHDGRITPEDVASVT